MTESTEQVIAKLYTNSGYSAGELPDFRQVSSSFEASPVSLITRKIIAPSCLVEL